MNPKYYRYSTWDKLNDLGFLTWFLIFAFAAGVIALERFTPLYISNFYIRLFFYVIAVSLPVFWLSWIFLGFKAVRNRIYIFAGVFAMVLAKALLTWGGDWKTQIILYENKDNPSSSVEFQMRADPFNFGYRKRIVEKKTILPFFDYVRKTDTTQLDHSVWVRTDKRVNELQLDNFTDVASN